MAQTLLYLLIAFITFEYILSRVLDYLNLKNWSDKVPDRLKDIYAEDKYRKAQAYDRANKKLSFVTGTLSFIIIILMLWFGGFGWLDEFVRQYTEHPIWMALMFFGILFIASDIINLPFSIYAVFGIEERFGFNKMTPKTFVLDKVKGYLLTAIVGGGILSLIIYFYYWAGDYFWLVAWVAVSIISLFFTMFYTSVLVPIFNKLRPLEEGELRNSIESYAEKVKFPLKNTFVIDGSKRSTKANAYFSGLGHRKSIVLFDTLIEKHTNDELTAVLAHEVGHYKKKHIQKGFVISTIQMGVLFFLLGIFLDSPVIAEMLGAEQTSFHIGLIGFGLLYSPISMVTGLLMNMYSRKNEYEADAFAKKTYSATPLKEALKKLSVDNLSNLNPHPAYVFVYYSHPPLLKRLNALDNKTDQA